MVKKPTVSLTDDALPVALLERIVACKAAVQDVGVVLRGTVTKRYIPCGKKGCRCQADPPVLHGPYHEWTTKVRGKTKTVRLDPDHVATYQEWIAAGRHLDAIVAQWHEIGVQLMDEIREKTRV